MLGPLATGGRHLARTRLLHAAVMALVLGGVLYQVLLSARSGKQVFAGSATRDQALAYGEQRSRAQPEGFFVYPRYSGQSDTGYPSSVMQDAPASPAAEGIAPMIVVEVPLEADGPATTGGMTAFEAKGSEPVVTEYEVVQGDNIYSIAKRFGVSLQTLVWANNLINLDFLSIGQRLIVPGGDGVLHAVEGGDTVSGIAQSHGVSPEVVLAYPANRLAQPDLLQQGQQILVPIGENPRRPGILVSSRGGTRPVERPDQAPEKPQVNPEKLDQAPQGMTWPTSGPITAYFVPGHAGIDLAPAYGTVVRATADGRVTKMEKLDSGWGWYLMVDHGGGVSTLYSHLSRFEVGLGNWVAQGQAVGRVGTTGTVTGPNLHFEVWRNGVRVNPLDFLP